jgi:Rrf2 family protein
MKLSTRSTYGLRALIELAMTSGRAPVSAAFIAKRQDLSLAYLEQLLHRLKTHGLVRSVRGPRGGYVLSRESHQVPIADVVRALEEAVPRAASAHGGASASSLALQHGNGRSSKHKSKAKELPHGQRIAQVVWRCVCERLTQSLEAVTLQDLCDEAQVETGEPLDRRYAFHL